MWRRSRYPLAGHRVPQAKKPTNLLTWGLGQVRLCCCHEATYCHEGLSSVMKHDSLTHRGQWRHIQAELPANTNFVYTSVVKFLQIWRIWKIVWTKNCPNEKMCGRKKVWTKKCPDEQFLGRKIVRRKSARRKSVMESPSSQTAKHANIV